MKYILFLLIFSMFGCSTLKKDQSKDLTKESKVSAEKMVSDYKDLVDKMLMESYGEKLLDPQRHPVEFLYLYELILDAQACSHYFAEETQKSCKNEIKCLKTGLNQTLYRTCEQEAQLRAYEHAVAYEDQDPDENFRVQFLVGCMDYMEEAFLGYNKIRNYNSCVCLGLKIIENQETGKELDVEKESLNCYQR